MEKSILDLKNVSFYVPWKKKPCLYKTPYKMNGDHCTHVVCYVGCTETWSLMCTQAGSDERVCVCVCVCVCVYVCVCPNASSRPVPFTVHAQPQWGTHGSCLEPLVTGLILKSHPSPAFHSSCWSRTGKPNRPQNFHSERKKLNK